MREFENSPEIVEVKKVLREFFMEIIGSITGAFEGFIEWVRSVKLNLPPMLKLFGNSGVNGSVFAIVIAYITFINIKAYRLFAADKRYARQDEERIPEWRLLANMLLGGAIGGAIAMYRLRHKTQHKSFTVTAKVLVFVYLLLYSFVIGFLGFWTFF